ncbi:MAG: FAD binding domain-containing protein [Nocardioides sp.]
MDLTTVTGHRRATGRADLALTPGETYLAGGTWLFSEPQPGLTGLVDLGSLGWAPLEELSSGGVRIGATCTIAQLHAWPWPSAVADLVGQCADSLLMSFKVQHAATVGGNVCLALPAGAMIALLTALDAEAVIWTPDGGERREPVATLVRDPGLTSLTRGEVLRALEVAPAALAASYAFARIALTPYGRTSAMVIARRDARGATLTIAGSTPRPVRLEVASAAGVGAAIDTIHEWYADPHGAPDWRAAMTRRLAVETVARVLS